MPNEGFLRRWSRLKAGEPAEPAPQQAAPAALQPVAQAQPHPPVVFPPPQEAPAQLPTLDDVAALGPGSDFSAFVSQGVDKAVQRLAMKKLFADPHFRLTDGLDVYIDDYTRPDPVSAAMLASLDHARSALARAFGDEPPPGDGQRAAGDNDQPPGGEQPPSPQGNA